MSTKKRPSTSTRKETQSDDSKSETCFLAVQKKRRKRNTAYHYLYDEESVAQIPKLSTGRCSDEDRDCLILAPPEDHQAVTDNDIVFLKQELSQLSLEIILKMLYENQYNVAKTIEEGKGFEIPDMIPPSVKKYFIANIATERLSRPVRGHKYKQFYFAKMFRGIVDTKVLVDFYYREKNKIDNNWRQLREDTLLEEEKQVELAKKMKTCNITLVDSSSFLNSTEALRILEDKEEEEISSENSETDEKPVSDDFVGPNSKKTCSYSSSLKKLSNSYRSLGSPN